MCRFLKRDQLQLASDDEMIASWRRMQQRADDYKARRMTAADFQLWQQASGITWDAESLLASPLLEGVLKPCKQWVHDWLHCLLSNGIFALGAFLLLSSLDVWDTLFNHVAMWFLPKHLQGINIKSLFEAGRVKKHRKSEKINATASELMTLEPILTYFVEKVALPAGSYVPQCEAYLALATVVQMFQCKMDAQTLQAQVELVLHLWMAAGWQEWMIKKRHWLLHFPSHLEEHGMIASCFTAERKHKDVSRHGVGMCNTKYFERGVLDEVINQEFHALSDGCCLCQDPGLVNASPLPKTLLHVGQQIWPFAVDVRTGHTVKLVHGSTVSKGDVVLLHGPPNWKCGMVNVHLSHAGRCVSVVTQFSLVSSGQKSCVWKNTQDLAVVDVQQN